ncbi:MAG: DNA mismatch repair protein MutS [Bacteroidota bacterium]
MSSPRRFYKNQLQLHQETASNLKKQLFFLSTARLTVFLFTITSVYFLAPSWQLMVVAGLIGASAFLFLLSKYTSTKQKRALHLAHIKINQEELRILTKDFYHRQSGEEFKDSNHFFSLDIDLFGKGSFFQYLNRTVIIEGAKKLSELLLSNAIDNIKLRQDAIGELSKKPKWIHEYSATASLADIETPASLIIQWLKSHKPFIPKAMGWIPWMFSGLSIILLVLASLQIIPIDYFGYWLILGLLITGYYLKKVNLLSFNCDKAKATFKQYAALLNQIENANFSSELLKQKQAQIKSDKLKASQIFLQFSKHLDALDNRNNLIGAIFGNGYLLLDLKNAYKVERWISTYATKVEDWFEIISFFDAYNSLGTYTFNHPSHNFPHILSPTVEKSKQQNIIEAIGLGHPLLDESKRVNSDVTIKNEQFFIVTGANMAGKSTFLRTISLHIVMANLGLPVCASTSKYSPIKLITSMRTTDSLTDNSSYFFSELTRLKFIVDAIENDSYFIILDEILKGTNSTDKAIGSKKFVEKLVANNATGIIATHDLSLCEISEALKQVENYYFDAEIIEDELHFDYKLKKGICQNMNASFLLKKMEIV